MHRRTFTQLLGAGAVTAAAPAIIGKAAAADQLKVAFVYVGPIGDFGWSYQHNQGRLAVEAKFGDQVKTSYVENVAEGPDSGRVLGELASKGNHLIFATSFGYMNPTVQVARRFPDVKFEHCTGYKRSANLSTYNIRFYEGRYIQGVIAGAVSKTGVAGYVAPVAIPEVVMGMDAFLLGMQSVNPAAKLKFIMINAWYDPGKEGDAAKALLDQGCDVLTQHTDSPAPLQVAESRHVTTFGEATDMITFAPTEEATAGIDNWGPYYIKRVQAVLDNNWTSTDTWGGLAADMLTMAPYRNIPPAAVAKAKAAEAAIRAGNLQIFKGPLKDQTGAVKVASGAVIDDTTLSGLGWLVQGIEGSLPS